MINSNFDLETIYILRKPTNRHLQWYIGRTEILLIFSHEMNKFLCQQRNGKSQTNKVAVQNGFCASNLLASDSSIETDYRRSENRDSCHALTHT